MSGFLAPPLLARSPGELQRLWEELRVPGEPPSVSWRTHVALGARYMAGCPLRILGATVDSHGVLALERNEHPGCFRLMSATDVIVVAVPRRILPQRFVWDMTFVWDGWLAGLVRDEGPGPASRSGVAFDLGG